MADSEKSFKTFYVILYRSIRIQLIQTNALLKLLDIYQQVQFDATIVDVRKKKNKFASKWAEIMSVRLVSRGRLKNEFGMDSLNEGTDLDK